MPDSDDYDVDNPITQLPEDEAWALLGAQQTGRLATAMQRRAEIFPINFVLDGRTIVFRTSQGSKLLQVAINENVAFEVDGWEHDREGWSVICHGTAEIVESQAERDRLEELGLTTWIPTVKTNIVKIHVNEISGRRFVFGPEPEL